MFILYFLSFLRLQIISRYGKLTWEEIYLRPVQDHTKLEDSAVWIYTSTCFENQPSKCWCLCRLKNWPLILVGNTQLSQPPNSPILFTHTYSYMYVYVFVLLSFVGFIQELENTYVINTKMQKRMFFPSACYECLFKLTFHTNIVFKLIAWFASAVVVMRYWNTYSTACIFLCVAQAVFWKIEKISLKTHYEQNCSLVSSFE